MESTIEILATFWHDRIERAKAHVDATCNHDLEIDAWTWMIRNPEAWKLPCAPEGPSICCHAVTIPLPHDHFMQLLPAG